MGVEKIVLFGSCGVLNHEIADGHIIVPTSAVRDEGTSYHYLPVSEEVELENKSVDTVVNVLDNLGYPYVLGKTWTTDGVYRETKAKLENRKREAVFVLKWNVQHWQL